MKFYPTVVSLLLLLLVSLGACKTSRTGELATPQVAERIQRAVAAGEVVFERYRPPEAHRPDTFDFPRISASSYADYLPDPDHPEYLPVRYFRLNFHVLNTTDTLYPLYGDRAVAYSQDVLNYSNHFMRNNPVNWLNVDSVPPPALPVRIEFIMATDPETGRPAVYEHYTDKYYAYVHTGPKRNRADRSVIQRYYTRHHDELNIFWMGPPRESIDESKVGQITASTGSGIFLGNAIKVSDVLYRDNPAWSIRQVFTHELGHALGLGHAWTRNDGCDDTPPHANQSWKMKEKGPGLTSNNLMDYSPNQEALTPCQIGRMHSLMANLNSQQRNWLEPRWCTYRPDEPIVITTDLRLDGARDYASDILVKSGATLTLNNRIHLAAGAGIRVEPGAKLVLGPAAILHNDCGDEWRGIEVGRLHQRYAGVVETDSSAVILNVPAP